MLESMEERLQKLEKLEPDLGDSMRELQMEMAKLWYAKKFHNDPLARYELKEIKETVDMVEILRPVVKGVNVAGVLDAMKNTQIAGMEKAMLEDDPQAFLRQYRLTLRTCNQCHRTTGVGFNRITIPLDSPVPNQDWTPDKEEH